jgi:hypothetical protein
MVLMNAGSGSGSGSGSFLFDDRQLDSLMERPLPSLQLDKTNFNDRITEYEEGCAREEKDFDTSERTRREKFQKYMKKKREKLKEEIQVFKETYDPFEVLGLPKGDYNLSNIRKAYKKMALKYHPDKVGEQYAPQFQVITQSYIYLLKSAEEMDDKKYASLDRVATATSKPLPAPRGRPRKKMDGSYDQSARSAKADLQQKILEREADVIQVIGREEEEGPVEVIDARSRHFDVNRFNQMFEKMKMTDEHDEGYGDLLKGGAGGGEDDEEPEIFNKNMNREIFNAHFDSLKAKKAHGRSRPVLPDAVDSSNFVSCAKIGSANGDFSAGRYSDIKKAHYEENLLIDPSTVQRREYRNVDDLEKERSRISYAPDAETQQVYSQYDQMLDEQERQRQEYVSRRDAEVRRHHQRVSKKISVRSSEE